MKIDISKAELVAMINGGSPPNYQQIKEKPIERLGTYSGSFNTWAWNRPALSNLSESELLELREILKTSWAK